MLPDGKVVTVKQGDALFHASIGGLGAFGLITAVDLTVVSAFTLRTETMTMPLSDALARWPGWVADGARPRLRLWPHAATVAVDLAAPTPGRCAEPDPEPRDDARTRMSRRVAEALPVFVARTNRDAAAAVDVGQARTSWTTDVRMPAGRTVSAAWTVPATSITPALLSLEAAIDTAGSTSTLPVVVQHAPADPGWLSPFGFRPGVSISATVKLRSPFERFFVAVGDALTPFEPRPQAASLATGEPHLDAGLRAAARSVALQVDPDGRMSSKHVARLLGQGA